MLKPDFGHSFWTHIWNETFHMKKGCNMMLHPRYFFILVSFSRYLAGQSPYHFWKLTFMGWLANLHIYTVRQFRVNKLSMRCTILSRSTTEIFFLGVLKEIFFRKENNTNFNTVKRLPCYINDLFAIFFWSLEKSFLLTYPIETSWGHVVLLSLDCLSNL